MWLIFCACPPSPYPLLLQQLVFGTVMWLSLWWGQRRFRVRHARDFLTTLMHTETFWFRVSHTIDAFHLMTQVDTNIVLSFLAFNTFKWLMSPNGKHPKLSLMRWASERTSFSFDLVIRSTRLICQAKAIKCFFGVLTWIWNADEWKCVNIYIFHIKMNVIYIWKYHLCEWYYLTTHFYIRCI